MSDWKSLHGPDSSAPSPRDFCPHCEGPKDEPGARLCYDCEMDEQDRAGGGRMSKDIAWCWLCDRDDIDGPHRRLTVPGERCDLCGVGHGCENATGLDREPVRCGIAGCALCEDDREASQ